MNSERKYGCEHCGKGVQFANKVSHAKNRMKIVRRPNLHTARLLVDGQKVKAVLCTKCLRMVKKALAIKAAPKVAVAATA